MSHKKKGPDIVSIEGLYDKKQKQRNKPEQLSFEACYYSAFGRLYMNRKEGNMSNIEYKRNIYTQKKDRLLNLDQ